jgi:phospholipid transport system substrate-binding protein
MAKLSLGKKWKTLTKEHKSKFIEAYVSRMKSSYSSKIDDFSDEKIKINKIKKPKPNRLIMFTSIIGNNDPINIDYKYYKTKKQKPNKKRWLIYDVNIKGISIIKTDRAQFRSILKRSDIDTLIKKMQ